MNQDDFAQARRFIAADITREIQLSKCNSQGELGPGITPGAGNFLAALGLLCYTEFGGKLRFGHTRPNENDASGKNFSSFFDLLGPVYKSFREEHNVYDIFRCGLAHEYYVKKNCTIYMTAGVQAAGIGIDASGKFYVVVEQYYLALMKAFDDLEQHRFPS